MRQHLLRTITVVALVAAFAGCSREGDKDQDKKEQAQAAGVAKDNALKSALDGQVAKRGDLAAARNKVVEQMIEKIEATKKALGTDDEAKIKAALENDPAWKELYQRCQDANAAIDENRRETMGVVREKLGKIGK